jgi:hypothetical protein
LSFRARVGIVAGLIVITALILVAPGPLGRYLRRTANVHADRAYLNTPDPVWDAQVNGAAFRRAARILPPGATYYIYAPTASLQLRAHDLPGAGLVFFSRALPVKHVRDASWILSYDAPRLLPAGVRAARVVRVAGGIRLIEVAS